MQPFKKATQTLEEVTAVGTDLRETAEWATAAFIGISCVSLVALLIACRALTVSNRGGGLRGPF